MSSDAAAIVAFFDSFYTQWYCNVAAAVLFFCDTFGDTFEREVAVFWTARRSGASFLFFANKWIFVLNQVAGLVDLASFPSDKFVPAAVFSALRAYVLSRSSLLALLVLVLSLAPVAVNLVHYAYNYSGEIIPPFGCTVTAELTQGLSIRRKLARDHMHNMIHSSKGTCTVVIASRVPLIIADMILVYITWSRLSSRNVLRDIRQHKRLSLADVILRDGTIYFVVLFTVNVLHLVFSVTALAGFHTTGTSYATIFTGPLTTILISRFLIDLQEADLAAVRLDPDDPMRSSERDPYHTGGFISSLGAFINPDVSTQSEDELELQDVSRSDAEEEGKVQLSAQPEVAALSA
ncbi:hypothetical protein K466DRAFT_596100 [Polyporus arcularius HHB13444]|uniref:DUF6533 domain-containing protein n=1 Tax=Polyporus arcularius HHB13444 TaxID=1314778 RepID=A0A5C3PQL5_9APHY|nr:hypothetical protein K466DRAFT_596100 [Polyporus arcularius HHB13444]